MSELPWPTPAVALSTSGGKGFMVEYSCHGEWFAEARTDDLDDARARALEVEAAGDVARIRQLGPDGLWHVVAR